MDDEKTILPPHPYTEDDVTDRVLGELRALTEQTIAIRKALSAASALGLVLRGKVDEAARHLYINGKNDRGFLIDVQRAAEELAKAAERAHLLLRTEDQNRDALDADPEFGHLIGRSPSAIMDAGEDAGPDHGHGARHVRP